MSENTVMFVLHFILIVINLGLVILLFFNRADRLIYEKGAKSEREYIMQLFLNTINKIAELIEKVEETNGNGKHE